MKIRFLVGTETRADNTGHKNGWSKIKNRDKCNIFRYNIFVIFNVFFFSFSHEHKMCTRKSWRACEQMKKVAIGHSECGKDRKNRRPIFSLSSMPPNKQHNKEQNKNYVALRMWYVICDSSFVSHFFSPIKTIIDESMKKILMLGNWTQWHTHTHKR